MKIINDKSVDNNGCVIVPISLNGFDSLVPDFMYSKFLNQDVTGNMYKNGKLEDGSYFMSSSGVLFVAFDLRDDALNVLSRLIIWLENVFTTVNVSRMFLPSVDRWLSTCQPETALKIMLKEIKEFEHGSDKEIFVCCQNEGGIKKITEIAAGMDCN